MGRCPKLCNFGTCNPHPTNTTIQVPKPNTNNSKCPANCNGNGRC